MASPPARFDWSLEATPPPPSFLGASTPVYNLNSWFRSQTSTTTITTTIPHTLLVAICFTHQEFAPLSVYLFFKWSWKPNSIHTTTTSTWMCRESIFLHFPPPQPRSSVFPRVKVLHDLLFSAADAAPATKSIKKEKPQHALSSRCVWAVSFSLSHCPSLYYTIYVSARAL